MAPLARTAHSDHPDPETAVAELAAQLGPGPFDLVLLACGLDEPPPALAAALDRQFGAQAIGCTTAGQIGTDGYRSGGIDALALGGGQLRISRHTLSPLSDCQSQALRIGATLTPEQHLAAAQRRMFGLLLVDGLSMREEWLCAALYQALPNVPIVGGSAADAQRFVSTTVYHDGAFRSDAAVFLLCETELPFHPFKLQNFIAGPQRLVITDACPEQRLIREINGFPALQAYAQALQLNPSEVDSSTFAEHPLMLRLGDDYFVRAVHRLSTDQSLQCFCAIENWLVLRIGQSVDPLRALEDGFAQLHRHLEKPAVVIGFECVLRRIALQRSAQLEAAGKLYAREHVFGFLTYGEQYNGLHVNQTFTGIALGAPP